MVGGCFCWFSVDFGWVIKLALEGLFAVFCTELK